MALENVLHAPLIGVRTSFVGLWTVCEYSNITNAAGDLIDTSGSFTWPNGTVKAQHNLTAAGAPGQVNTSIMKNDGNLAQARSFNGSTQIYDKAYHSNFAILAGNVTATVVFSHAHSDATIRPVWGNNSGNTGLYGRVNTGGYSVVVGVGTGQVAVGWTSGTTGDSKYHVGQFVKIGNVGYVIVDGVKSVGVNLTGATSSAVGFALGALRQGSSNTFAGNVPYFRLDAEALSDEVLEFQWMCLLGAATYSPSYAPVLYTRAANSNALSSYKQILGKLYQVAANNPRVGTDSLLIEETRTNYWTYSQAYTGWGLANLTMPSVNNPSPDPNSNTAAILHESGAGDVAHQFAPGSSLPWIANEKNTGSLYIKSINRSWVYIRIYSATLGFSYTWFNITIGKVGTKAASHAARITPLADGWFRIEVTLSTGVNENVGFSFFVASADNTLTFDAGAGQDSIYVWQPQHEVGAHATSPILTTTAVASRSADDYTLRPWELNTALLLGSETWYTTFEQDVASLGTVSLGGKTFTQAGDVKHVRMPDLKHYYDFDGTGDYLSIADNSFNPAGSFSVVMAITPSVLTAATTYYTASKLGAVGNRGWSLWAYGTSVYIDISKDGTTQNNISKASALTVGKTSLITATYTYSGHPDLTDSRLDIYVDDLVVASKTDCVGPVFSSTASFQIATVGGSNSLNGKLHFLSFHNGTVLTQAQHNELYARMKTGGILPLTISSASYYKKLLIEFEAKALYSSSADIGMTRSLLSIAGMTGIVDGEHSAEIDRNVIHVLINSQGKTYVFTYDKDTTSRYLASAANYVSWSSWHKYQVYLDTANLANSYLKIDGVNITTETSANWTGATTFYLENTKIRLGQNYAGVVSSNANLRNIRIACDT
jgi:hypothetical protein